MVKSNAALNKRQLISQANRNIFTVVAIAFIIIGFCATSSVFLLQKAIFRGKVIGQAQNTVQTLKKNGTNITKLETNILTLRYDEALQSVSIPDPISSAIDPLRTIGDAMPIVNNPTTFGASLSDVLLNVAGVNIDSVSIAETSASRAPATSSSNSTAPAQLVTPTSFSFSASGSVEGIQQILGNLERSIRSVTVNSIQISYSTNLTLSVKGALTYNTSPVTMKLTDKTLKPSDFTTKKPTSTAKGGTTK